jgi:hypothetical protein
MIIGAHSIIYSQNGDADRAFLREVLGFPSVDVGGGWLIFGLPPGELAIHPGPHNDVHELYLMTDDVEALVADMTRRGVDCSPIANQGWGMLTQITLPGGGKLGIYQPRHARPPEVTIGTSAAKKKAPVKAAKKPAKAAKKPAKAAKKPAAKKSPKKPPRR